MIPFWIQLITPKHWCYYWTDGHIFYRPVVIVVNLGHMWIRSPITFLPQQHAEKLLVLFETASRHEVSMSVHGWWFLFLFSDTSIWHLQQWGHVIMFWNNQDQWKKSILFEGSIIFIDWNFEENNPQLALGSCLIACDTCVNHYSVYSVILLNVFFYLNFQISLMLVIPPQFLSSLLSSHSLLHLPLQAAFSVVHFMVDEIWKNVLNKEWYNHLICNDHKIKIQRSTTKSEIWLNYFMMILFNIEFHTLESNILR